MLKVVIVGASAHSTPALFDTPFRLDESRFAFALVGRNVDRLAAVGRAIDVAAAASGYRVRKSCVPLPHLGTALSGADVVVVQVRVGGYAARQWDERFPHRYGLCGDEGLGVGGLAAAWRTWPELRAILECIATVRPQALVLLLTSPIAILSRCALEALPQLRLFGMCELPWTTLVALCGGDERAARRARFAYVGTNHVGWFSDVRSDGRVVLDASSIEPLKYVALGEDAQRVLSEQLATASRGRQLEMMANEAFDAYERGSAAEILRMLRRRATPWYRHALVPLLVGLTGSTVGTTFFLTHRNAAYCSWLGADDVVEMPFEMRSSDLHRLPLPGWSRPDVATRLAALVRYEATASRAVLARDETLLAEAVAMHPWLDRVRVDQSLVCSIVAVR